MGDWTVIVEGANTYSAEPARRAARARMERAVSRQRGVLIATDYLVHLAGVIFVAIAAWLDGNEGDPGATISGCRPRSASGRSRRTQRLMA